MIKDTCRCSSVGQDSGWDFGELGDQAFDFGRADADGGLDARLQLAKAHDCADASVLEECGVQGRERYSLCQAGSRAGAREHSLGLLSYQSGIWT